MKATTSGAAISHDLDLLYRQEGERLWRAIFATTRDREVTDDAVAEAFAQCIRRGAQVRDPKAWLWKAAFKIAAGDLKRRARFGVASESLVGVDVPQEAMELLSLLGSLPRRQRTVLVLRHYMG